MNINTMEYWEKRFSSLDWGKKGGREQTKKFAQQLIKYLGFSKEFKGTLCDFGCGLGDAFPIYHAAFPNAKLLGIDFSESAIKQCIISYGHIADFIIGDYLAVPEVDIVISSAVFEHLDNDLAIAIHLLSVCKQLFVVVPYKERPLDYEHINYYDEKYFRSIGKYDYKIYDCPGWSEYGFHLIWQVHAKNLIRPFFGGERRTRNMFILFHFDNLSLPFDANNTTAHNSNE